MIKMSPEECIDKLEHLILDEDELVTYKLLSKELKIHVNEAKKYLYDFLMVQKSKEEIKLYVYYFLSGIVIKNGEKVRKIVIVSEDNLENVKEEFEEVTSCHIYSLNKGGCRDVSSLYNSQSWCKKWAEEHKEYSAIKHPNIVIQAPVIKKIEIKKTEVKSAPSKAAPTKQVKTEGITSLFKNNHKTTEKASGVSNVEKSTAESSNSNLQNVNGTKTSEPSKSSEPKDEKKSTLSSMWQKLEDKTKNSKPDKTESKGKKSAAKSVSKNNIMSMFSKQAEKIASNPVKKVLPNSSSSSEHESPILEKEIKSVSPKTENKICEKVKEDKNKKKIQKQRKRISRKTSDDESDEDIKPKKKKHRRICTMDDSDSESENEEEQDKAQRNLINDDEPVPDVSTAMSDDSEEPIPPTPPIVNNKGKKKAWQTVQKTFEDEEGFLVSKQEKVLVSASDSDEDPLPSKENKTKSEPKQNTSLYRKQASLTSFFKQR